MLLWCQDVAKSFGAETILDGVGLRVGWGQKVGLVGRNGCGKTTLLRILSGQMEADGGLVRSARGVRIGYLRQEQMVEHGWTVLQEAQDAFSHVTAMERRLRDLQDAMAEAHGDLLEETLEEYGLLHDRFEAMGGYDSLRDVGVVLQRLGFTEADHCKPTQVLSGGEKTRLALARLLLSAPDVLLLDEPTNHLDLPATEWLETFLNSFGGAVLVVSHDRTFLDRIVGAVAEIDNGRLTLYTGNFSAYWMQRAERRERQMELYERQQAEIERLEEFWRRNKNNQKRNLAWSRFKAAQKLRAQELGPPARDRELHLKVQERMRGGNEVLITDRLCRRYGDRTLFDDVTLMVTRGQRVGIVGPNGAGKSTLVRVIMGREPATSGNARFGAAISVGYYAQEAEDLDPDLTVIETMMAAADMTPPQARAFLARFLFSGDSVFEPVERLSGGEKSRLALAILIYAQPNLLVLDEPTNHLDIDARSALAEMLCAFTGTLVVVSHDRFLLDTVTNHTIEVRDGRATQYDGSYSRFREQSAAKAALAAMPPVASSVGSSDSSAVEPAPSLTAGMNSHQLAKARKKALKDAAAAEQRVTEVEDWMKRIEETLSAPMPGDDPVRLAHDYQQAQEELAGAMDTWENAVAYADAIGAVQ